MSSRQREGGVESLEKPAVAGHTMCDGRPAVQFEILRNPQSRGIQKGKG